MMKAGGNSRLFCAEAMLPRLFGQTVHGRTLGGFFVVLAAAGLTLPYAHKTFNLVRAGTAYSAKMLCSGVLMAGMDENRLKREELALAQGLIQTQIDATRGVVHAWAFLGLVRGKAVRQGNLGCSQAITNSEVVKLPNQTRSQVSEAKAIPTPWKISPDASDTPPRINRKELEAAISEAFHDSQASAPKRTRAIVVVQDGWVIAERYAPGITPVMPLIGWSMTKSITHALIGIAVKNGQLRLNAPLSLPEWSNDYDARQKITLDHLLRMNSGLNFDERTRSLDSDVVQMLTQEANTATFATGQPLTGRMGRDWSYSSGTTNIISRGLRLAINNDPIYWSYPYEELFKPIGMESAYLETDASGNFVASSLGWASARDWARFGLLYLNQGAWNDQQILPKSWVQHAVTASKGSKKRYGAHWWLSSKRRRPDLPRNSYSAEGYEGQLILVVPSFKTVIVRLGQTPKRGSFNPNKFGASILSTLNPQMELQPNKTP